MTRQTAGALQFYAIGLVAYSALKVLTPAFYAVGKRNTPMMVSFLAIAANLFLNWLFTSLVATINFLLLYALMRRHTRRLETRQMLVALGKISVAGAMLALICWAANYLWLDAWSDMRFLQKLAILLVTIAVAGAGFFGAAFLLRISEVQDIIDVFRRKVGKL